MNFKILRFDETQRTMVIDWGWITLNHHIPMQIINNPNISEDEAITIIERERPKKPEPIDIPPVLQKMSEKTLSEYNTNGGSDDEEMI